jgi:hypothetical protein
MALKDMALTAEEAKAQYGDCCAPESGEDDNAPKYPWGLSMCLGDETLAKLGIGLMPVGTEIMVMAKATVTGTSSRQRQSGDNSQDMDIQITALDLAPSQVDPMQKAAGKLYPGS